MSTREQAIAAMTARVAGMPTGLLCDSLMLLDRKRRLDDAERLTRAVLIDVLCERHPEADAAFTAWAEDDSTMPPHGAAGVITRAARAVAR